MEIDIEDLDALQRYLLSCGHIIPGEDVSLTKLSGGVSNRTVRVLWADGHGWVLKQALEKLRVDVDWFSSPDRIQVEAKALRWFNRFAPPGTTPSFAWEDTANHLMAMEAIPEGHENWKTVLLREEIVPQHFEQFGWLLGTVHRQSSGSRTELRQMFGDTSYFELCVCNRTISTLPRLRRPPPVFSRHWRRRRCLTSSAWFMATSARRTHFSIEAN